MRRLPGYIKQYRSHALELLEKALTTPDIPDSNKLEALNVLFLTLAPEIRVVENGPHLLRYAFIPLDEQLTAEDQALIDLELKSLGYDCLTSDDERLRFVDTCAGLLEKIITSFEVADRWPGQPARLLSFKEAGKAWQEAQPTHNTWNHKKSERIWRHRLFEIDIYRPKNELLDSLTTLVDKIQADLGLEEEREENTPECRPSQITSDEIEDKLLAFYIVYFLGWQFNLENMDFLRSVSVFLAIKKLLNRLIIGEHGDQGRLKQEIIAAENDHRPHDAANMLIQWMEDDPQVYDNWRSVRVQIERRQKEAQDALDAIKEGRQISAIAAA
ncbi:hypothetical protein [uncultured Desulfuromonas sp.]|uniref:hypothetical protein n=1 Tax=uncultured Desulfuromonas sp. TaxID=181013 RepID=UPI002AAB8680|nr:hypothetical protein [uncultured Desulfuromonas sp.]